MSFIHVLRNVRLERNAVLCADGLSRSGDWRHTELDLNELLGNNLGNFDWSSSRFGDSARSIELQESMLIARLDTPTITRGWTEAAVDLSEHIVARDSMLTFVGSEERYRSGTSGVDSGTNNVGDTSSSARSKKPGNGEQEEEDSRIPQRPQCSLATEAFTYNPLPTPTSIRLLRLCNTDVHARSPLIECSLTISDLADHPDYCALSYTWMDPGGGIRRDRMARLQANPHGAPVQRKPTIHYNSKVPILCNGKQLLIYRKLYDFLSRLDAPEPREPEHHKTPLISAAEAGDATLLEALLVQGADVTSQDRYGASELHYAAENGHEKCVRMLVAFQSNPSMLDNSGRTPLNCAEQAKRGEWSIVVAYLSNDVQMQAAMREDLMQSAAPNKLQGWNYFWIDAICINQKDKMEKSKQVRLMEDIYSSANRVIVWLGESDDLTPEVARVSAEMHSYCKTNCIGVFDQEAISPNCLSILNEPKQLQNSTRSDSRNRAITALFERSWFRRAWVIQESALAKRIDVFCGYFHISWDILVMICRQLSFRRSKDQYLLDAIEVINKWYSQRTFEQRMEFPLMLIEHWRQSLGKQEEISPISALALVRNYEAYKPQDKVYVAQSLSSGMDFGVGNTLVRLAPDYMKTIKEVYMSVARYLLTRYGPSFLSFKEAESYVWGQDIGLPSWVPDLRCPMYHRPLGLYSRPNVEQKAPSIEQPLYKTVQGRKAFQIVQSTQAYIHGDELVLRAVIKVDTVIEASRHKILPIGMDIDALVYLCTFMEKLRGSREENMDAIWRTLIADTHRQQQPAPPLLKHFQKWIKWAGAVSYYGRSDFATVKEQQFAYLKAQNLRFSGGKPCGGADIAGWKKERNDDVQRLGNVFSALDVQISAQELKSWQTDLAAELIHQFDYSYNWKTEKIESLCDEEGIHGDSTRKRLFTATLIDSRGPFGLFNWHSRIW